MNASFEKLAGSCSGEDFHGAHLLPALAAYTLGYRTEKNPPILTCREYITHYMPLKILGLEWPLLKSGPKKGKASALCGPAWAFDTVLFHGPEGPDLLVGTHQSCDLNVLSREFTPSGPTGGVTALQDCTAAARSENLDPGVSKKSHRTIAHATKDSFNPSRISLNS